VFSIILSTASGNRDLLDYVWTVDTVEPANTDFSAKLAELITKAQGQAKLVIPDVILPENTQISVSLTFKNFRGDSG
jgi:hypothetical protein